MKNKYLVISSDGSIHEASEYLKLKQCSADMQLVIGREALGIKPESSSESPAYLKYAAKLGFNWEPNADIGFIQYNYKANLMKQLMFEYSRQLVNQIGFPIYEVSGSNMFDLQHPVVQSYAQLFGDRLFKINGEKHDLVMSYDASYPQFNLAGKYNLQEKHLPLAHFSISDCYRYEQSGECMLLFRGRRFNMPDLHPYMKSVDEAFEWYYAIEKQIESAASSANRRYINVAKVSSLSNWEQYQSRIIDIAKKGNKEMLVEIKMDGADRYWIVDIDYSFIDKLGQVREIGCIQIDVGNAERLGIEYQDKLGKKYHPVIIHAAVPGGIERYLYMLFDNFKESFPIWLQPIQLRLIPVSEKYVEFCKQLADQYPHIRIDIDDRSEVVSKRIKSAREELIPNILLIGEKEMSEARFIAPSEFKKIAKSIQEQSMDKPFMQFSWPRLVSQRVR